MQANAINCIDHIIENFPVRIREVWTDNSHEFKAKFHWQVEDLGIRRVYIKCAMPQWNRTASSSGPTILISRNSTSYSVTKATSIGRPNSTNGNGSTTLPAAGRAQRSNTLSSSQRQAIMGPLLSRRSVKATLLHNSLRRRLPHLSSGIWSW